MQGFITEKNMNEFILLGHAKNYVPVIFDLIEDIYGPSHFTIYHNLDEIETPDIFLNEVNYQYTLFDRFALPQAVDNVLFGVNGPKAKNAVYHYFSKVINRANFIRLVHPTSYVSKSAQIMQGVIIEPNCTISSQSIINFGVNLKRNVSVGHHVELCAFSEINPGVVISSNVKVGNNSIIGSGTVIKDGISIGENSLIGMGSVVTRDIPSGVIAYGNPCKVIRENVR